MQFKSFMEALKGNQHKLDKNKNGKLDAHDFKLLQKEEDELEEGVDRVERSDYKVNPSGRKSHRQIDFKNGEPETDEYKAKMQREESELEERSMTDAEMKKREDYVKGMKKNVASFKAKYGDRAKDVMYATATKMAMKEDADLEEAFINGREYASHGLMHPDHAKMNLHQKTGQTVDFYAHGTGDKISGKVTKNDGKSVHIQADKSSGGKLHKFKVTPHLPKKMDEAKQPDLPFDPPYKKATDNGNVKDKSGATHTPMSQARHLARQAMKKQMKESFDLDITDEQADSLVEAATTEQLDELSKGTIGSYIKKAKGSAIGAAQVTGMGSSMTGQKTQDKAERKVQKRAAGINKAVDRLTKEDLEVDILDEAVESGNKGNGYHGQHDSEVADKKYSAMHAKVKKVAGEAGHLRDAKKPNVMVKHYLDSRHGRHLAGNEHDHEYIKKDFGRFKKAYKPELHESVEFDEEGNLMSEKLKFSDFIAKINEQLLEYESDDSGVYRHTKKATYGTAYQGDDDEDEKPKKAPAEKRGRGRPAGSYGGSYKARSAETKAAAAAKAAATKAAKKK